MLKVGLTGGIGSGKTFVANIFTHLGIPVYNADTEAKKLYDTDSELLLELRKLFGSAIFNSDKLDKKKLAAIVFSDAKALSSLNALVHPAVEKHFRSWVAQQQSPYIIQEAAILFESGFSKLMDKVVVITAPTELRVKRVVARDGVSSEQVYERMQHQLSQDTLAGMADFIITTAGDKALLPQVLEIHQQLLALAR